MKYRALSIIPARSRMELVAAGGRSDGVGAAPGRDGLPQGLVAGFLIKARAGRFSRSARPLALARSRC